MLYSSLHCNMTHEICKSDLNPHLEVVWNGSSAGFLLIPVSLSSVTHNDGVLEKYNTRTDTEIHRRLPNPDARYSFHYNSVYEDIFGYVNVTFCVEMRPNSKFTCVLRRALGKCDTLGVFTAVCDTPHLSAPGVAWSTVWDRDWRIPDLWLEGDAHLLFNTMKEWTSSLFSLPTHQKQRPYASKFGALGNPSNVTSSSISLNLQQQLKRTRKVQIVGGWMGRS